MVVKVRKFSEFVPVSTVDEVVGLTNGQNAIGGSGGGGGDAPADGTYIVQTADPDLQDAQALDELPPGLLVNDGAGNLDTTEITGGSGVTVTGGTGSGDPYVISSSGGGGDGHINPTITQPGNGYSGLEWVRVHTDGQYVKALADQRDNSETVGVVSEILSFDNSFKVLTEGRIDSLSAINPGCPYLPLIPGNIYFLSLTDAGEISLVDPTGPTTISRPCFLADGPDSGYVKQGRSVENEVENEGGDVQHGMVFLGRLDSNNSFSNATALMDDDGSLFNTYHIYIENGAIAAGGINAQGPNSFTMGLQLFIAGAWLSAGYNFFLSGVRTDPLTVDTGHHWLQVRRGGSQASLVISAYTNNPDAPPHVMSLSSGLIVLDSRGSTFATQNTAFQDFGGPSLIGYSAQGLAGKAAASAQATGLRVWASNGAVLDTNSGGYISIYGIRE